MATPCTSCPDPDLVRFLYDPSPPLPIHSVEVQHNNAEILQCLVERCLPSVEAFSSTDTLDLANSTCLCSTGSSFTLNLPTAASSTGHVYIIKKVSGDANTLTIDPDGSETIDGETTITITDEWDAYTIQSDGTDWFVLNLIQAAGPPP